MARKKAQAPHSADTRAVLGIKGFAGIPKCVVESEAYRTLTLIGRAILIEMVARMDGYNNGAIHVSYAELAHRLGRQNQAVIGPAIADLMQRGFIALSEESIWQERKAREYRLTFVNTTDSIGRPIKATNDYLDWKFGTTDAVAAKWKPATPFVAAKLGAATDAVAMPTETSHVSNRSAATDGVIPILQPYPHGEPGNGNTREAYLAQLRVRLIAHLQNSPPGTQTRLAAHLAIPPGTLSKFVHGRGLADYHATALAKAVP